MYAYDLVGSKSKTTFHLLTFVGKCLNFEFSEDFAGSLFSMKGPRETTALLDIERALNKLEKVAIKRRRKVGRPLVLIINKIHLLRDDDDGRDLLELMQQKAEQWASSNLITVIFNRYARYCLAVGLGS